MSSTESDYERSVSEADRLFDAERYSEAYEKYELLVTQGNVECAARLGVMASKGLGRRKSYEEAMRWYKLAAEHGVVRAQFNLAALYAQRDEYDLAIEWYKRAADQGFAPAMYRLGLSYRSGTGVPRDEQLAIRMLEAAADCGHLFAQQKLARHLFDTSKNLRGKLTGLWRGFVLPLKAMVLHWRNEHDPRIVD